MTGKDGHCNKSGMVVADFEVPIPTDLAGIVIAFCTYIREGYRVIISTGPAVLSNNGTPLGQTTTKLLQASHSLWSFVHVLEVTSGVRNGFFFLILHWQSPEVTEKMTEIGGDMCTGQGLIRWPVELKYSLLQLDLTFSLERGQSTSLGLLTVRPTEKFQFMRQALEAGRCVLHEQTEGEIDFWRWKFLASGSRQNPFV